MNKHGQMVESKKANGLKARCMEKVNSSGQMANLMKETSRMIKRLASEALLGILYKVIKI